MSTPGTSCLYSSHPHHIMQARIQDIRYASSTNACNVSLLQRCSMLVGGGGGFLVVQYIQVKWSQLATKLTLNSLSNRADWRSITQTYPWVLPTARNCWEASIHVYSTGWPHKPASIGRQWRGRGLPSLTTLSLPTTSTAIQNNHACSVVTRWAAGP